MKKIFITILLLMLCGSASAADYTGLTINQARKLEQLNKWINYETNFRRIQDIALTRNTKSAPLEIKTAAELGIKNADKALTKAVTLKIGKSIGKKLLGGAALMGAFALGEAYIDWLISQGDPELGMHAKEPDYKIWIYQDTTQPVQCQSYVTNPWTLNPVASNYAGHYPTDQAAASVAACLAAGGDPDGRTEEPNDGCGGNSVKCLSGGANCRYYQRWVTGNPYSNPPIPFGAGYAFYGECTFQPGTVQVESPATYEDLEQAAANGWDNDELSSAKWTNDILDNYDDALHDPEHDWWNGADGDPWTAPDNPVNQIRGPLHDSVTEDDIDILENELNDPDVPGEAPQDDLDKDKSYYEGPAHDPNEGLLTGLIAFINQLNANAANETLTPLAVLEVPDAPEVEDTIKPIIDNFILCVSELPIVSFFTDLKNMTFSGDCTFTLDLPNPFTSSVNTVTLSMCPYQGVFDFMGSCLLMIVGVRWTFYLFEG